jgi:O-antigen ligase
MIAASITVAVVGWYASDAVLMRFESSESDMRVEGWPVAFEAAQAHLPGGAGMGAFDRVYRSVEPLEQVDETYFNRAHNDYLETWLEAGWGAAAILIAFLIWYGRRLAVLAHSFVDYPLRTITIAVVFALCCALLERRAEPGRERSR